MKHSTAAFAFLPWCLCINVCVAHAAPGDFSVPPEILVGNSFTQIFVADFDGDGHLDLATGNVDSIPAILVHRANGTLDFDPVRAFTTGVKNPSGYGRAAARLLQRTDLNGDGRPDLLVANNYGYENLSVLLAQPGIAFAPFTEYPVRNVNYLGVIREVRVGDLDGDGNPDVVVGEEDSGGYYPPRMTLFWNSGDGTFIQGATLGGGGAFELADFNRDGRTDIACGTPGEWFPNIGSRGFGIPTPLGASGQLAAGDLNGDGTIDLVFTGVHVFLQKANGGFDPPVDYPTEGDLPILCTDLDSDGDLDLVVATTQPFSGRTNQHSKCSILSNTGNGVFTQQTIVIDGDWSEILAEDIDADGRKEIVLHSENSCALLASPNPTGGPYVAIGKFGPRFKIQSASITDVDEDGTLDLLAGMVPDGIGILRLQDDGTFLARRELETSLHSVINTGFRVDHAAVADFGRDGRSDLLLQEGSMLSLLAGSGPPQYFGPPTVYDYTNFTYGPPRDLALGDTDGDGDPDVVLAVAANEVRVVPTVAGLLDFSAAFHLLAGTQPTSVAAADFDGDGRCDVAANGWDRFVLLLQSTPSGFAAPLYIDAGSAPRLVRSADVDGDQRSDLVVARANDVVLLRNLGFPTFAAPVVLSQQTAEHIAIADLTGDGAADLALGSGPSVRLLLNAGDGSFTAGNVFNVAGTVTDLAIGDLDGDALPELVVPSALPQDQRNLVVLKNDGNGDFSTRDDITLFYGGSSVVLQDLDGDGRSDLVLGASSFRNRIVPEMAIAVEDLAATAMAGAVRLEWRLSTDVRRELAGIVVERAQSANGPYEPRTPSPLAPEPSMFFVDPVQVGGVGSFFYRLALLESSGKRWTSWPLRVTLGPGPVALSLNDVRQSHRDGEIEIRFEIPPPGGSVRFALFDVRGRLWSALRTAGTLPGKHVLVWSPRNGVALPRGVYLVQLKSQRAIAVRKLLIARSPETRGH